MSTYPEEFKALEEENERLRKVIRGALAIKNLWLRPMSQTITIQQRDEEKALWIMKRQFEQALENNK